MSEEYFSKITKNIREENKVVLMQKMNDLLTGRTFMMDKTTMFKFLSINEAGYKVLMVMKYDDGISSIKVKIASEMSLSMFKECSNKVFDKFFNEVIGILGDKK